MNLIAAYKYDRVWTQKWFSHRIFDNKFRLIPSPVAFKDLNLMLVIQSLLGHFDFEVFDSMIE